MQVFILRAPAVSDPPVACTGAVSLETFLQQSTSHYNWQTFNPQGFYCYNFQISCLLILYISCLYLFIFFHLKMSNVNVASASANTLGTLTPAGNKEKKERK